MIYQFTCDSCGFATEIETKPFKPPSRLKCNLCESQMRRVYGCQIDTSGCRDQDDIPVDKRVMHGGGGNITSGQAQAIERAHAEHNQETRKQIADGGNRGTIKKTMQIPAHLFHGKIKQTGDKHYWDDDKNRNRHKSCRVD